jgi:hypothetical protein
MKQFNFKFEVICATALRPDLTKVEEMINLAMQDLVYDDEFIAALGERESVTIRVSPILDKLAE